MLLATTAQKRVDTPQINNFFLNHKGTEVMWQATSQNLR